MPTEPTDVERVDHGVVIEAHRLVEAWRDSNAVSVGRLSERAYRDLIDRVIRLIGYHRAAKAPDTADAERATARELVQAWGNAVLGGELGADSEGHEEDLMDRIATALATARAEGWKAGAEAARAAIAMEFHGGDWVVVDTPDPDVPDAVIGGAFPPDESGLIVILRVYCDESGTDQHSPWVGMAGWVSEPRRWKFLTREWRRLLKRSRVSEAHAKEMQACQGDFQGWSPDAVEEFRKKLCVIIDRHVRFGVAVSVRRADYEKVVIPRLPLADEHAFGLWRDPYAFLMLGIIALVVDKLGHGERASFVFDRGHRGQSHAEDFFYWALDADVRVAPRIVRSFQTADSFDFPPLQAADQLAWGCTRGARLDVPAKRGVIEMRGIPCLNTPVFGGTYEEEALVRTLENVGVGGPDWPRFRRQRRKRDADR